MNFSVRFSVSLKTGNNFCDFLSISSSIRSRPNRGWSDGAMVLAKRPVPSDFFFIMVGQGHTVLAVGAGGGCL